MREITLGERTVTIAASPITPYIYSREFGPKADLVGDLLSLQAIADGRPEDARFLSLFKILWAMAKTAKLGGEFPGFEEWLQKVDADLSDESLWTAVLDEVARGLFRRATTAAQAPPAVG